MAMNIYALWLETLNPKIPFGPKNYHCAQGSLQLVNFRLIDKKYLSH